MIAAPSALLRLTPMFLLAAALTMCAGPTAFAAAGGAPPAPAGPEQATVQASLDRFVAGHGTPGIQAAVLRDGELLALAAAGTDGTGGAMTTATRMRIESLSKSFTALAVLQLVESGELDLDGRVADQLPELWIDDPRAATITPRQLLQHTSGMTDATAPPLYEETTRTLAEAVARLESATLATDPGTAADMARWIAMQQSGGTAADGTRIVMRESVAAMHTPGEGTDDYGFGWYRAESAEGPPVRISHSGAGAGVSAYQGIFEDSGYAVVVIYVVVAAAIVISVQTIGNVLVLALLVTPAAAARLLTDRLGPMMLLGPTIGGGSALVGLYLSWSLDLPVGGTIVLVATAVFLLAWLLAPRHGVLTRAVTRRAARPSRQESRSLA